MTCMVKYCSVTWKRLHAIARAKGSYTECRDIIILSDVEDWVVQINVADIKYRLSSVHHMDLGQFGHFWPLQLELILH